MLINSLTAHNFRKYHTLEVSELPKSGVITIAGENESGKTSIGEAICFALFGRTFFLDEKNIHKIVSWGRDVAEVTLEFSTEEGEIYHLYRNLHRDGISEIKLKKVDSTEPELNSNEQATEALSKLLGFDYDAFSNSFYLVQRELTTPDPHSDTIKQMAGISDYAQITDELTEESDIEEKKILKLAPQMESTQADLDEINLDEEWLAELMDADHTLTDEKSNRAQLAVSLKENEQSYAQKVVVFQDANKSSSLWGFLSIIALITTLFLAVIWGLNYFQSKTVEEIVIMFFGIDELSAVTTIMGAFLLPFLIVSGISFVVSRLFKSSANKTMAVLSEEAIGFSDNLKSSYSSVTTSIDSVISDRVAEDINNKNETQTVVVIPSTDKFANLDQLTEDLIGYKADTEEVTAVVSRITGSLDSQNEVINSILETLLKDIGKEKVRSEAAGKLRSALKVLTSKFDKCNYNIGVYNISKDMLKRAAKDSISLFNNNIAEISAKILPHFTEGRYCEVRIAEDLSVKVHSDEKDGFMDFDEISSGTQRQVMLALRLAMSEELAKNTGNNQQFIFLDEPFAFFDQNRTKSTLQALPGISKVISQIWIVAQEFPADVDVSKAINCPSDKAKLLV